MNNIKDLTIVIASNFKNIDQLTVHQINKYASNDIKVIISIPPNSDIIEAYKIGFSKAISIIKSKYLGQVYQRQYALKFCKTDFVLQMDDDIEFDIKKIDNLLSDFKKLPLKSCLAPYLNSEKKYYSPILIFFKNIFLYFNLNPKPGSISRSSFPIPYDIKSNSNLQNEEVSWLPGGILILRREDIIIHFMQR